MSKAITGLVFLALVFGAYSTTSTIISGVESTPFDTTANADTDGTYSFSATYSAVGPGSAAATQYLYGVTVASSLPSTIDTKSLTVTTSDNTVAAGTYNTNQGTFTLGGTAITSSRVLAYDGYYVLITLEAVNDGTGDTYTAFAYWWLGSDTTPTAPTSVTLKAAAGYDSANGLALGNAWYASSIFYVVLVQQAVSSGAVTDTSIIVTGLDVSTAGSEAAIGTEYDASLSLTVSSTLATNTIGAMGACATASSCTTITVVYNDGTDYVMQDLIAGTTQAAATTLTLPDSTATYATAGVVGLSTSTLVLLSQALSDVYTLVAYEGSGTSAYTITPASTATAAPTVYWHGIANGNTEPSIIIAYTTSSGTTYDYLTTTVAATAVEKIYTFGTFDYAPSIFVDATPQLWVAWFTGSAPITAVNVAPLGSSILMSAIAFVSMIVMTLFMF